MNEFSKLQIPNSESAKPNNSKLNNSKSQAKPRITQNSKFLILNSIAKLLQHFVADVNLG